jgi:hypothetical protein
MIFSHSDAGNQPLTVIYPVLNPNRIPNHNLLLHHPPFEPRPAPSAVSKLGAGHACKKIYPVPGGPRRTKAARPLWFCRPRALTRRSASALRTSLSRHGFQRRRTNSAFDPLPRLILSGISRKHPEISGNTGLSPPSGIPPSALRYTRARSLMPRAFFSIFKEPRKKNIMRRYASKGVGTRRIPTPSTPFPAHPGSSSLPVRAAKRRFPLNSDASRHMPRTSRRWCFSQFIIIFNWLCTGASCCSPLTACGSLVRISGHMPVRKHPSSSL